MPRGLRPLGYTRRARCMGFIWIRADHKTKSVRSFTAAKLGDRPAFAELWERHWNKAFKIAYRITRNREDDEDVIQDAWTKAYVHLKSFDGRARFSTWITSIAINTALMTLRRKHVHREISTESSDGETWPIFRQTF